MDITHDLIIKASPETIYHAVSSEKGITGWWSKDCSVGQSQGQRSHLKFNKEGTIVEMGFLTLLLDPNKKVIWECVENGNPAWLGTKIITEISPSAEGCKVRFSHAEWDEKWKGMDPYEMTKTGWEHFIKSLKSYCEKGQGQPW